MTPIDTDFDPSKLIGVWSLCTYERIAADGSVTHPLGIDCKGSLLYTSMGIVAVQMMRSGRPLIVSDNVLGGLSEERANAVAGYIAYTGRYEVLIAESAVVHHVDISLFPNWLGQSHKRYFTLLDASLTLTTPRFVLNGQTCVARMNWSRYEAP